MTNSFVYRWLIFKKRIISQILKRWLIDNKTTLKHLYNIHKNMYIVRKVYGFHVIVIYIYYSDKIYTIILKLNKIIINPPKVLSLCLPVNTIVFVCFFEAVLFFSVFQYYFYNTFIKSYD